MIGELKVLLELMQNDPYAAARELDLMGDRLKSLAKSLRRAHNRMTAVAGEGYSQPCGSADRVTVEVFGPDGALKQRVQT